MTKITTIIAIILGMVVMTLTSCENTSKSGKLTSSLIWRAKTLDTNTLLFVSNDDKFPVRSEDTVLVCATTRKLYPYITNYGEVVKAEVVDSSGIIKWYPVKLLTRVP